MRPTVRVRFNLGPGRLVLVGDGKDPAHKGDYCLGRVHCLHSQLRQEKEIVRRNYRCFS